MHKLEKEEIKSIGCYGGTSGKEPACQCRRHKTGEFSPFREDLLEASMATHPNIPARRTPWTEEPGGLESMRRQKVGHD